MYVCAGKHICGSQRSVSDVFPKEPFALLFKTGSLTGNWGLLSGLLIRQGWLVSKVQGFLLVSEPPVKAGISSTSSNPGFIWAEMQLWFFLMLVRQALYLLSYLFNAFN